MVMVFDYYPLALHCVLNARSSLKGLKEFIKSAFDLLILIGYVSITISSEDKTYSIPIFRSID
jgi:hypothetical protein